MSVSLRLMAASALVLLAGCEVMASGDSQSQVAPAPKTLSEANELWQQKEIRDYQATVQRTCYCPADLVQPIRLTVVGGKVAEFEGLEQPVENMTRADAQGLSVEGLFGFIRQAQERDPHKLEVTYDARLGFPTRIIYDGHPMIADDERQYQLTDFKTDAM